MHKVNIYGLCNISSDLFDSEDHELIVQSSLISKSIEIKKYIEMYGGIKLQSKTYLTLYIKNLLRLIYLGYIDKDHLFCLQTYFILIDSVIFVLPLDEYELKIFNSIYADKRVSKIVVYAASLLEINKFILQDFIKIFKIKLCYYKKSRLNNASCIQVLLTEIRKDISSISGSNIFCNRLYDLKL